MAVLEIVGAAAGAYALAVAISDWAERSCVIEIANMSADYWDLVRKGSSSGSFQEPTVTRIEPFNNVLITAVSGDFGQGAVGNLGFRARDLVLLMDYSNPVIGNNDLDASFEGARGGEFQLSTSAGPGNKGALFRCVIEQPVQEGWRYCPKCHGLFNDGPGSVCPAGGSHDPVGWEYALLHDVPDGPTLQANWRFCPKCRGLVAGGDPGSSRCPAGGPHDTSIGWSYCVPHDLPDGPRLQRGWRFCPKCHGLFAGGDPANSRCPAGGPHDPVGWIYNMAHKPG
ncbi:hypothetical protein [Actinokineospora sp. HUAS TT18]|uniref:hypothetical protein n=1 Tax=Actinokineospora sp. HUAS TT18 TaxID=3447451 RepID=UPI003F5253F4